MAKNKAPKSKTVEQISEKLMGLGYRHSNVLDEYLDHWLHHLGIKPAAKVDKEILELVFVGHTHWSEIIIAEKNCVQTYDFLGTLFEQCSLGSKKQMFGQFFTPEHICGMISKMIGCKGKPMSDGKTYISDPTCGSSRMLLAAASEVLESRPQQERYCDDIFFAANDLDHMCTKMSLINFYLHGLSGEVTCANGLFMDQDYRFGYKIDCIPLKRIVENNYPAVKEQECKIMLATQPATGGRDSEGKDIQFEWFKSFNEWHRNFPSIQEVFDGNVQEHLAYCIVETKETRQSWAGDNYLRVVTPITKEQSVQVAIERNLYNQPQKPKEQAIKEVIVEKVKPAQPIQLKLF